MAYADYRLCDICDCKTFYNSNLDYCFATYPKHGLRLGDWKVICEGRAQRYEVVIQQKET